MKPIAGNNAKYPKYFNHTRFAIMAIYTKKALVPIHPTKNNKNRFCKFLLLFI
jgi:hypothetical protein